MTYQGATFTTDRTDDDNDDEVGLYIYFIHCFPLCVDFSFVSSFLVISRLFVTCQTATFNS